MTSKSRKYSKVVHYIVTKLFQLSELTIVAPLIALSLGLVPIFISKNEIYWNFVDLWYDFVEICQKGFT